MVAIKIVDDILLTEVDEELRQFTIDCNQIFQIGEVVYRPGTLRFNGLNLVQDEHLSVATPAEDKFEAFEPYPMTRVRFRQIDEVMNCTEQKSFLSFNASRFRLGITVSPSCSFSLSYLQ